MFVLKKLSPKAMMVEGVENCRLHVFLLVRERQ
jgi:hypothetical protein